MGAGRGERFHISIFGKTNSGKSSLLNALIGQDVSIVSEIQGTTTDPVYKNFELLDAGPVVFIDTAGYNDGTSLADAREKASANIITKTDLALIVLDVLDIDYNFYKNMAKKCHQFGIATLLIFTKIDLISPARLEELQSEYPDAFFLSSFSQSDSDRLLNKLTEYLKLQDNKHKLLGDLLPYRARVLLVVPIDKEAPKGRIINPQVQVIRDALDHGYETIVVRDTELEATLKRLEYKVDLVITDSQAFSEVSRIVPEHIYLTSFSILFIRYKGDLSAFVLGVEKIKKLGKEDVIAICESCSHNISCEDIGRFKIPLLLANILGFVPEIDFFMGSDFPEDPGKYSLIIHCGACMTNRQTVLSRIELSHQASSVLVNYGIVLAYGAGILDRSLKIFKDKGLL